MKAKIFTISLMLLFTATVLMAQTKNPTISFEKNVHDYGKIDELKGPQTYEFKFTNTGGTPLIVSNVKASCGCTTPDWTKEPVLPGKTGFVKATYDPKNRPGPFNKTITITSNAENATVVLTIKGDVAPKPKTIEDDYPQTMGELRLRSNHLAFTNVLHTQVKTDSLLIVNMSQKPMTISFEKVPEHITIKTEPKVLKPSEKGKIVATYNAPAVKDWGFVMDRIAIVINGEADNKNNLSISATIQEDFTKLTPEQKANAAKIQFETTSIELGDMTASDKKDMEFKFTNTGKAPLLIRKVKASCGCTAIAPSETEIAPGKSSVIKAKFDATGRTGKQNKTITVITNDPDNHTITLRFAGDIK